MASQETPVDPCVTQPVSMKSQASQTTPLATPEISAKIQVSTSDKPPLNLNLAGNQSLPISPQSAVRLIQDVPLYPPQNPPSRSPEGIQIPTPIEVRPRVRQDTQFTACDNRPLLSRSCRQPSTSGNVQFRTREDMQLFCSEGAQSPVPINSRAILDRPLSSSPGYVISEEPRELPQAGTVAVGSEVPGSTPLDWIVPVDDKCHVNRTITVSERLQPTLAKAKSERDTFAGKAKLAGLTLNVAIFLQVVLGSLTTGVAAGNGKEAAIGTTILGALSTIVASFLARARGSGEPELSVTRVKDLEQYIREVDAFLIDHGGVTSNDHDEQLHKFRMRFEELLGNMTHKSARGPPASGGASNV